MKKSLSAILLTITFLTLGVGVGVATPARAEVSPGDVYQMDCATWLQDGQAAQGKNKKANDSITRFLIATGFALGHFQAETGTADMSPAEMQELGRKLIAACRADPKQKYTDAIRGVVTAP